MTYGYLNKLFLSKIGQKWVLHRSEIDNMFSMLQCRDEDPDPVGSVDFWPAGSGSYL